MTNNVASLCFRQFAATSSSKRALTPSADHVVHRCIDHRAAAAPIGPIDSCLTRNVSSSRRLLAVSSELCNVRSTNKGSAEEVPLACDSARSVTSSYVHLVLLISKVPGRQVSASDLDLLRRIRATNTHVVSRRCLANAFDSSSLQ